MKQIVLTLAILSIFVSGYAQKRTVKKKIALTETAFYIKNVASGRYLDLPGYADKAQRGNGSKVVLWDHDTGNDRKYKFKDAGDGHYYIMPQHCNSRLDVHGCFKDKWFCNTYKNDNGAEIQIWQFDTNEVGRWRLEQVKKGQFVLINKYSGKVMDAAAQGLSKNGCKVQIWSRNNSDNQLWELIDVKTGQRYEM